MTKVNVVVLTKGTDLDLFARFYSSLLASDFPKDHVLTVVPPHYSISDGRTLGVEIASQTAEFILLADCDILVPPIATTRTVNTSPTTSLLAGFAGFDIGRNGERPNFNLSWV